MDKNRYTKIPVRKLSPLIQYILKSASGEQLDYLSSMRDHHQYKAFIKLVEEIKYYCMSEVFNYPAKDNEDLALFRAGKKGQYSTFFILFDLLEEAKKEIKRRKDIKY